MKRALKVFGKVMLSILVLIISLLAGTIIYISIPLDAPVSADNGIARIYMDDDEFNILVITDTHFMGMPLGVDGRTERLIAGLVYETQPDLIMMLGDNVATPFNHAAWRRMIRFMDGFNIPWAPLFGNHDSKGKATFNYLAQMLLTQSTNTIFRWGHDGLGMPGNYKIEIVDSHGAPVHNFFMLSSPQSPWFRTYYFPYTQEQLDWLIYANDENVPATLMLHQPLPIFLNAWNDGYRVWGGKREGVMSATKDPGIWYEINGGDLQNIGRIIAGHDHINDFKVKYQGVYMMYTPATNRNLGIFGAYGRIAGASLLTVNSDGTVFIHEPILR